MANDESIRSGDSRKPRPQVLSAVPARKPASTAAEPNRGNTAGESRSGPTELPAQFGRYRVIKKLGGGGMGTVYLVENTELEREEALKVPHFGEGDDPQLRERFLREAKSAAKLDHANLCPIYVAGVQDGIYYMTMRFLKGKLLSEYTGKTQPARKAVEIVTKLAQALEAAHTKGVIHRDLKPSNVMMVAGVGPVVMDFGLAKRFEQEDQNITKRGSRLGTPAYMPPEQVKGELEGMGPASDVYSLGVILYELLTGRLPFEGTMAMIFGQILYTEPPLPSTLVPGLNPTLDGICRKAMARESAERYPSMKAFATALTDFVRSTPTDGAGNLVPTAVDKAAVFPVATAGPERQPAGNSDVSQAPGVPPQARRSFPPTPREAKAPAVIRHPEGAPATIPKVGATAPKGKSKRPIRVKRTVGIGRAVGGAFLGILCCVLVCIVIVMMSHGSSVQADPRGEAAVDEWSREDMENAAHFVRAMQASDEAWELCKKTGHAGRPWQMDDGERQEFARLIEQANQEARLVRRDVLKRMHELLPDASGDFITSTSSIPANTLARRPDKQIQETWGRWKRWWQTNRPDVHVPEGARP